MATPRKLFQSIADLILISPTDAESEYLKQLGLNAIPNPFRQEDWDLPRFSKQLEGKTVIILCSKGDATTGCNDLLEVFLRRRGPYHKVVLSDEISNLNKLRILEAIEKSLERDEFRFNDVIVSVDHFLSKNIPPKKTILNPWLTGQSINNINGWRGTGKTWFATSIADAITKNESFGPWPTETPVPVCYVDGELPSADVQERFGIVGSLNNAKRKAPLYIYCDSYANSLGLPKANLSDQKWRETFKEFLRKEGFKVLVLDNISSLAPGIDENLKRDWDPINQWFLELRFSGISTIPIFHAGKKGGQRGTSAHEDNVDTSLMLSHPSYYSPEKGATFVLKFTKARVKNSDLHMIIDYEFSFSEANGRAKWIWNPVKGKNQLEILRLIDSGMKQSKIAEELEIDKSYVSRIKAKAIKNGHLTQNGRLTQEGVRLCNQGDSDEE